MTALLDVLEKAIEESPAVREAVEKLASSQAPIVAVGPSGAGEAFLCAMIARRTGRSALLISYNIERARRLADDLSELLRGTDFAVQLFPDIAAALHDGVLPEHEDIALRLRALDRLASGKPTIVVAPISAALSLTVPPRVFRTARMEIGRGEEFGRDELIQALASLGYQRVPLVDDVGQFAARGGIVDFSPPTLELPVRVEFFGEEIDSIRLFDPETQRSVRELDSVALVPAGEVLLVREWVERALPAIRSAFRRELDRLYEQEKRREADRLRQRMAEDTEALEQLRPTPQLMLYLPYLYPEQATLADHLPEDALIFVDEPVRVKTHAEQFLQAIEHSTRSAAKLGHFIKLEKSAVIPFEQFVGLHLLSGKRRVIYIAMLRRDVPWDKEAEAVQVDTPPPESFGGRLELLVQGVQQWLEQKKRVLICTRQAEETLQALRGRGLKEAGLLDGQAEPGSVKVAPAELSAGFTVADAVVLTSRELYGWAKIRQDKTLAYKPGFSLTSLRELKPGDYVVHINHGIGIYRGMTRQTVDGIEREYLLIEYAEGDKLYVPVTQLDRVQKYVGIGDKPPAISKLHSGRWERTKRRARRSALALAQELLMLYRAREQAKGHAFSPNGPWMRELEASFPYEETPDQLRAVEEIHRDMEQPKPMDRLLCGDVGFGKTEVAIRAAFKAVLDGKQVAVLVPTTVLAQQHYNVFRERLSAFPVEIAMLSRFRSRAEQRKIIQGLKEGTIDIVIGTHRLLMSDVQFKDLGLLIIDEEHKFGVAQKEKIKKLKHTVDVLTMTATPIPRTLNMALSGIRDISVINDPPRGRLPVRTFVRERDDDLIAEAIRRELARGGQVFFVHNRVQSISHVAAHIQRLVPEARVAVAHGQMDEADLERVMMAFYAGEFDVLVCTTIIESGLDVPNANTIIVDDADKLGLAQLYQLRGRVGRSDRQAYCYLLYRYPEHLTEEAEERLKAIEEFSELGSGLKLALRDLEIRGAGNILGPEQSGHLAAVGLDLFCEMLADSVRALKGDVAYLGERHATIDLPVEAVIPPAYIEEDNQRIAMYRRLGAVQSEEELAAVEEELRDRYGPPPKPVENLIRIARLRLWCWKAGVTDIEWRGGKVTIRLHDNVALTGREQRILAGLYRADRISSRRGDMPVLPRLTISEHQISFSGEKMKPEQLLQAVEELVRRLVDRAKELARTRRPAVARTG